MERVFGARLSEFQTIIAEHYLRAEVWDKAADYLLRAGDESARLHAHAEARLHYAPGRQRPLFDCPSPMRTHAAGSTRSLSVRPSPTRPKPHRPGWIG